MAEMNILVTGGAGYVGSTLVPVLLSEGHRVRVLDKLSFGGRSLLGVWAHPAFQLINGDIRDEQTVTRSMEDVDAVVHLAAIVGDPACARDPDMAKAINLDASLSILEKCKDSSVSRFIFASTCSNYGKMPASDDYVDESSQLRPISLYAETKVSVEKFLLHPGLTKNLCPTVLRFSTVYGVSPRMRFDLTVNEFTMEMMTNKHLVVYGEQFWRPYIHVRDAARTISLVLQQPIGRVRNDVFNAGSSDENYRKQDLVEMIQPFAPDARIEYVHKDEDPRDYRVSFEKVKEELGFEKNFSVVDGIREVADLIKEKAIVDFTDPAHRN